MGTGEHLQQGLVTLHPGYWLLQIVLQRQWGRLRGVPSDQYFLCVFLQEPQGQSEETLKMGSLHRPGARAQHWGGLRAVVRASKPRGLAGTLKNSWTAVLTITDSACTRPTRNSRYCSNASWFLMKHMATSSSVSQRCSSCRKLHRGQGVRDQAPVHWVVG